MAQNGSATGCRQVSLKFGSSYHWNRKYELSDSRHLASEPTQQDSPDSHHVTVIKMFDFSTRCVAPTGFGAGPNKLETQVVVAKGKARNEPFYRDVDAGRKLVVLSRQQR